LVNWWRDERRTVTTTATWAAAFRLVAGVVELAGRRWWLVVAPLGVLALVSTDTRRCAT
jgi:hypothetical protein